MLKLLQRIVAGWRKIREPEASPYEGDSLKLSTAAKFDGAEDGEHMVEQNPNGDLPISKGKRIIGPVDCLYWLNGVYTQKFNNQKFFRYDYLIQVKDTHGVHTVTSGWIYVACSLENPSKRLKYARRMIQRQQFEAEPIKFRYLKQAKQKYPKLTLKTAG